MAPLVGVMQVGKEEVLDLGSGAGEDAGDGAEEGLFGGEDRDVVELDRKSVV